MTQSNLTALLLLLLLLPPAYNYSLEGAWDLRSSPATPIVRDVTLQFSLSGRIQYQLFAYNCFLSQFKYHLEDDTLRIESGPSRLLEEGCPIEQIDYLRELLAEVVYFQIRNDVLFLMDLGSRPIMQLNRQKIPYREIILNSWTATDEVTKTQYPLSIDNSTIYLCQGQYQLSYQLKLINESYPLLEVRGGEGGEGRCRDGAFGGVWNDALFFMVRENRSQLLVYSFEGKLIITLDQGISRDMMARSVAIHSPETGQTALVNQNHQNIQQQNDQNQQEQQNSQQNQQQKQQQQQQPSSPVSANDQGMGSFFDLKLSQFAAGFSFGPASPPPQSTQTLQEQNSPTPTNTISSDPTQTSSASITSGGSVPTTSGGSVPNTSGGSSGGAFTPFGSGGQLSLNTQSFGFIPTLPQPAVSAPSQQSAQLTQHLHTDSSQQQQSQQQQSQQQQSQQQQSQQVQQTTSASSSTSSQQSSSSSIPIASSQQYLALTAVSQLPLASFITQGKWLLSSMAGYRFVPPLLARSNLVFTFNRIILYCPCNTYYTTYRLDGSTLKDLAWTGTKNQCRGSLDDLLTNLVFYSRVVKQQGDNLAFFFDQKLKMVKFKPFQGV